MPSVERAVDEYVEHHREHFAQRMERAQKALLGGKTSALAYSLGVDEADIERVGGVASDRNPDDEWLLTHTA